MNMSGCKWYEKGIIISCMLTSGGVCIVLKTAMLQLYLLANIVNDSDIVVRTYHLSYLLGT